MAPPKDRFGNDGYPPIPDWGVDPELAPDGTDENGNENPNYSDSPYSGQQGAAPESDDEGLDPVDDPRYQHFAPPGAPQAQPQGGQGAAPAPEQKSPLEHAHDFLDQALGAGEDALHGQHMPDGIPQGGNPASHAADEYLAQNFSPDQFGHRSLADLKASIVAGFGASPEHSAAILMKYYGDENVEVIPDLQGKNVVYIRKHPGEKFQPADIEHLPAGAIKAFSSIGLGIAGGVMGAFGGPADIATIPAGATIGAALGNALGQKGNDAIAQKLSGVDPEYFSSARKREEEALSEGAIGELLGTGLMHGPGMVRDFVRSISSHGFTSKVAAHAEINNLAERLGQKIGMLPPGQATPGMHQAGTEVGSAVHQIYRKLEDDVGLWSKEAVARSGGKKFNVQNYVGALEQKIQEAGPLNVQKLPSGDYVVTQTAKRMGAFGEGKDGTRFLEDLVNRYAGVRKNHRRWMDAQSLMDEVGTLDKLSRYDEKDPLSPAILARYQDLAKTVRTERNKAFDKIFQSDPQARSAIGKAYSDFADNIKEVTEFRQMFDKVSPELFADRLITKDNSQKLRTIRSMLANPDGTDSPTFLKFRGAWVGKQMGEATDPRTGIFNAKRFTDKMLDLGEPVLENMGISAAKRRQMQALSSTYEKVAEGRASPGELRNVPWFKNATDMVLGANPTAAAGFIYSLSRLSPFSKPEADVAEYLLKGGRFNQEIAEASGFKKYWLMDVKREYINMLQASTSREVKYKGRTLMKRDLLGAGANALAASPGGPGSTTFGVLDRSIRDNALIPAGRAAQGYYVGHQKGPSNLQRAADPDYQREKLGASTSGQPAASLPPQPAPPASPTPQPSGTPSPEPSPAWTDAGGGTRFRIPPGAHYWNASEELRKMEQKAKGGR